MKGVLYYQDPDMTDNYQAELTCNMHTGQWIMDISCPTEKYTVRGEASNNLLVLRGDCSTFNLYKVDDGLYYGEWVYQDSKHKEACFVKLELDEPDEI